MVASLVAWKVSRLVDSLVVEWVALSAVEKAYKSVEMLAVEMVASMELLSAAWKAEKKADDLVVQSAG